MPIHRRFTARNALTVLLVWLVLALIFHLKAELWDTAASPIDDEQQYEDTSFPDAIPFSEGGNEPILRLNNGNKSGGASTPGKRRTAVVVASRILENATWLDESFPEWEKNIYKVDYRNAPLTVPKNKGRESMVYLTYIIDNYDNLPDNILFLHPNRYQWHNDDPDYDGLPMLRHFQIPYLEKEGYVNIRCAWSLGCPAEIKPLDEEGEHRANVHAGGDFKRAFEALFPGEEVPKYVGVSCCAQFAATKEKILERKKEDYERYREWLLNTELDDSISGRIFEYTWHLIMGKEPVHCPAAQDCYCSVFGLCELECKEKGSCEGRYTLPPYASLPNGWPLVDWDGSERSRSAPED